MARRVWGYPRWGYPCWRLPAGESQLSTPTAPSSPASTADTESIEFKKFQTKIDTEVPDELEVHLVCDNYSTHKTPTIAKWLDAHPRFRRHLTPTYSS